MQIASDDVTDAAREQAPGVTARHVLHLNLNTTDPVRAAAFYAEGLGLALRMKSGGDDGDWSFHGIEQPVSSEGWFLYDDRGPRVSPAVELVHWRDPATEGSAYDTWVHRGLTSLRFTVPSPAALQQGLTGLGGSAVGALEDGLLLRDPDGVHVELVPGEGPVRVAGARLGCADLDASLAWYATLGFAATRPPRERELLVDGTRVRLRSAAVALPSAAVELELTQWLDPVAVEPAEQRLWHRGAVRIALSVDDLDEAKQGLARSGSDVPQEQWFALPGTSIGGLRVLFLHDPDGFTVELVHRPPRHFSTGGGAAS